MHSDVVACGRMRRGGVHRVCLRGNGVYRDWAHEVWVHKGWWHVASSSGGLGVADITGRRGRPYKLESAQVRRVISLRVGTTPCTTDVRKCALADGDPQTAS